MRSLAARIRSLATWPAQVVGRLPELIDAVIRMPGEMAQASRELRQTRQELEEAEYRIDRLIQLSEVAIDDMELANAQMRDGNARLEELTPLADAAVSEMETGIAELRTTLERFRELSSALDDIPMVDTGSS